MSAVYLVIPHKETSPLWGIRALGCHHPLPQSALAPVTSWNMKDYALRLYPEPMRAETGRQDQVLRRGEKGTLSLSRPSLHFNQGLRYKILLPRAVQLWKLKHTHALSPNSFCIKKKSKKRKKYIETHMEKRGVFLLY